jgi:hypothetical protein
MNAGTRNATVLVFLQLLAVQSTLEGQAEIRSASVGDRVRVTPVDGTPPVIGVVTAWHPNHVDLADSTNVTRSLPLQTVRSVERSLGVRGHAWKGAGIGAAISGGLMLFALGSVCDTLPAECRGAFTKVALVTGIGSAFGAAIGSSIRNERWGPALTKREGLGARPSSGPGVSLTIAFSVESAF